MMRTLAGNSAIYKPTYTGLLPMEHIVAAEPLPAYTAVTTPDAAITGRTCLPAGRSTIIRGQKVMLDRDLSELYVVETKQLKRQVRRNITRFPEDFMPACRIGRFELTEEENESLRSQFGTLKQVGPPSNKEGDLRSQIGTSSWGGTRYLPMAFTDCAFAKPSAKRGQGVAMLSSVLNGEPAFAGRLAGHPGEHPHHPGLLTYLPASRQVREVLLSHREILQKLEQVEGRITGHDEEIQAIFDHLTELVSPADQQRKPTLLRRRLREGAVGFKPQDP